MEKLSGVKRQRKSQYETTSEQGTEGGAQVMCQHNIKMRWESQKAVRTTQVRGKGT